MCSASGCKLTTDVTHTLPNAVSKKQSCIITPSQSPPCPEGMPSALWEKTISLPCKGRDRVNAVNLRNSFMRNKVGQTFLFVNLFLFEQTRMFVLPYLS